MRIAVVGTGYVGLVTGTCLADMGHHVACHDVDSAKIARLARGEVPIYEPGLAELVVDNLRQGRLRFAAALATALTQAEVCFVAVGTPAQEDGAADEQHVRAAVQAVALALTGPLV